MATRISAEFVLTGVGFNPDEITNSLGIRPSKIWHLGDLIDRRALPRYKHDGWQLSTGYRVLDEANGVTLTSLVTSIFQQLRPHTGKILELCARLNLQAEMTCVIYVEGDDRPNVHFDADVIKWLAQLNAEIDTDLYVLNTRKRWVQRKTPQQRKSRKTRKRNR